jgi:hypothetical protein
MHKSATKCNETIGKWCKNKHGASKIIDTLETYQGPGVLIYWEAAGALPRCGVCCPATLGGERGQERDDNTRSGRCAIGSMLAKYHARGWSDGSGRGCRTHARQVLDAGSTLGARSIGVDRDRTKSGACSRRHKGGQRRLVARWFGQRSLF